jgi:hypothetical protein
MIRVTRLVVVFLVALLLPHFSARAQSQPTLLLAPNALAPGGETILSGYGFPDPGPLPNLVASSETNEYDLGSISVDGSGQIHATIVLPADMIPDTYEVMTFFGPDVTPVTTTLTVLPALTLNVNPTLGKPGAVITFTIDNAVSGQLRLDYAGAPVFGPSAIGNGTVTGTFAVPGNRPNPIGSVAALTATNFVAGRVFGRAYSSFQSQTPTSPPTYTFSNVIINAPQTTAGDPFTVTGQIVPPPIGPLTQYKLKALWQTTSAKTLLLNTSASLQGNGNFQLIGKFPSLFYGDPAAASTGDVLTLGLYDAIDAQLGGSVFGVSIGSPPALRIRVVNQQGQPIQGAMVSMVGIGLPTGKDTTASDSMQSGVPIGYLSLNTPNQIGAFIEPVLPPTQNPFACPPTDAYGPTDGSGYFQPVLNWDMIRGWLGKKVKMSIGYKEVYQTIPPTATFTIYVNALWQGYGTLDSQLHPQTFTRTIVYNNNTNRFYNLGGGSPIQTDPLTVTLPSLPPGTTPDVPLAPTLDAPQKGTFNWLSSVYPVYGPLYSFSDLIGNPAVTYQETTLRIGLLHDPVKYGVLNEVRLFLDNVDRGAFTTGSNPDCVGSTYYFFDVLNAHHLTPGWHFLRVEAHPTGVITPTSRTLILEYVKLPATAKWFYDSSYKNRHVTWHTKFVDLSGVQLPVGQPGSSSVLTATVPRVGYLENRAGADNWVSQRVDAAGSSKVNYTGGVQSKALNTSAPEQPTNQQVVGSNPIKFGGPNPISILDTGWMPLFRDYWGLWPIASATIGADMAFKATLIYNGTITFNPPHSTLFVSPNATVNVKAWFDLSALFGVVKAGASAIPSIGVSMPVTFENGAKQDDDVCFKYRLDIEWYGKVGVCPLCKKKSGTKNIFDDYTPKTALCAQAQAKMSAPTVDTPPPDTSPALAVDGFGHTLAVWSDDDNDLRFNTYNGINWSTLQYLIANQRSIAPKVAFFAPNQAIAVWSQNSLTLAQQQTASFTDTVRAQHLAYATWNGITWSAPLTLTVPATGEGGVVLASCLSTTSGCPATGAVTAVWIKDVAGALEQRQFRLFYATYQNGSWSAAQPIDAASTATDSEPTIVYQGGVPLLVWMRDTDRDVATIADRRLAYRLLNGGPIVIPNDLPTGIVEPSAAIDPSGNLKIAFTRVEDANAFTGNQRPLYSAAQACTPGCAWSVQKLQDNHGRALRAEAPLLTIDPNGKSTITFRGLGFGSLPNGSYQSFPEDAIGMLTLTGELAQVEVDFATTVHSPFYLTNDGAVNWHPAVVFDPALNQINTIVVKGTAPALPLQLTAQHSASVRRPTAITQIADEVVFNAVPQQPDFVVAAVTPSQRYPELVDTISITVQLRNDGATWQAGRTDHLDLLALWDGAAGVGALAGSTQLTELFSGQIVTATLILTPPINLDVTHTLYVVINPQQAITEATAANNQLTTLIGGLPVPTDLSALAQTGNSLVYLNWTPSTDRRVVGYRIYRAQDGGAAVPIGSTFVAGYVDLGASLDHMYEYRVTSYNVDGVESDLSSALIVTANSQRVFLPLIRR